jgi:hypothetical protein
MGRKMLAVLLAGVAGAPAAPVELPVRKVVLYKHGIGFFERAGQAPAGEAARLEFQANEMNDVLKSLTIEERGGGRVSNVRYDSSEPLEHKLAEYPFALQGPQSLASILDQLKGSRVELRFAADRLEGIILSARLTPAGERLPEKQELILLLDSGDMRAVDLMGAAAIRFPDPRLQNQFKGYLAALGQSRHRDRRGVTIESSAAGVRDLIANYVIPMPAWKSSYRLILDSKPDPLLEGWAIVDNTTGEDWSNVSLALVSGLPVSFTTRLYEPRYVNRPEAELPGDRAQRPILHAGGLGGASLAAPALAAAPPAPPATRAPAPQQAARLAPEAPREAPAEAERLDFSSSLARTAAGRELGDLFEYRIGTPVTIRSNESAMLPFVQQRIKGRRLLIFSEAYGSQHPLAAVEITNSSGLTLDGGAVTVIDGGAYAGESLVETIKAGDKRLISYAVDLGVRITTAFDSESNLLRDVRFRRGILTTRSAMREVKTFTVFNVDARAKTLMIETPVRPGFKLVAPQPVETTASSRRFEVKLAAGAAGKFAVTEERVIENAVAVANLTPDVIYSYVRNLNLDEAARKKLEPLADLKRRLAATDSELRRIEKQIQDLIQDQQRLRQNISSLNEVSGQQQRVQEYAQRLAAQEARITSLRDRQAELQQQKADLEQQINNLSDSLEI